MARLNVVLCDLCKKISKTDEPATLKAVKGRGIDKSIISAELCSACFDSLKAKIDTEVSLDAITSGPPAAMPVTGLRTPIASRRGPVDSSACTHTRTEFRSPFVTCLDCGNQEKI